MGRRRLARYAGPAALAIVLLYIVLSMMTDGPPADRVSDVAPPPAAGTGGGPAASPERSTVHLYFADRDRPFLAAEEREISRTDDMSRFASDIIGELIRGPEQGHVGTVPAGTALRSLYITPEGIAYVDMTEHIKSRHPGGSESELLTIYSIVNSLGLNVPGIEKVKILVGGRESRTLAGHIDLRSPFRTNMLLVR